MIKMLAHSTLEADITAQRQATAGTKRQEKVDYNRDQSTE